MTQASGEITVEVPRDWVDNYAQGIVKYVCVARPLSNIPPEYILIRSSDATCRLSVAQSLHYRNFSTAVTAAGLDNVLPHFVNTAEADNGLAKAIGDVYYKNVTPEYERTNGVFLCRLSVRMEAVD